MKTRKEKFEELVKEAGFNSIHDFANKTLSPYTGKSRSSAGIKRHLEQAPQDLRVLKGYAKDLNVSLNDIFELFDIELENDFNFEEYLIEIGFKRDCSQAAELIYKRDDSIIEIQFDCSFMIESNFYTKWMIPFKIESEKLAKKLIQ